MYSPPRRNPRKNKIKFYDAQIIIPNLKSTEIAVRFVREEKLPEPVGRDAIEISTGFRSGQIGERFGIFIKKLQS